MKYIYDSYLLVLIKKRNGVVFTDECTSKNAVISQAWATARHATVERRVVNSNQKLGGKNANNKQFRSDHQKDG